MNTIELANLLIQRNNWSVEDLAGEIGISRQVVHRAINAPIKSRRRDGFHLGVISAAFKHGFEAEALAVILKGDGKLKISTVFRAAAMYPDLKPEELKKLLNAEEATGMSPLSAEIISSVIEKSRS